MLGWHKRDGDYIIHRRGNEERLIEGYSETRAKKDEYNRKRVVERLRKAYK